MRALGGPPAMMDLAARLGIDSRELSLSASPLLEFDCGVGAGIPAVLAGGASRSVVASPRLSGAAAISVASAAAAGPLGSLFLGSIEALASTLAVFSGRDP